MANFFECCHHCKPPKRKTACWDHCPEYKAARAAYDEKAEKIKQQRRLANALNAETGRQVAKATRKNRRNRRRGGGT